MPARLLLTAAYSLQTFLWRVVQPRTRGVKVMLFNAQGELLLVRNSYGNTSAWVFPGGGVRPWEEPRKAAVREIREELHITIADLTAVSTHVTLAEGKRDTVHLFSAQSSDAPRISRLELEEARFFRLDALPTDISPATMRRIAEHRGASDPADHW
jgi:ADP-ribose pyrophosphatase YjhB (NUDIX family)